MNSLFTLLENNSYPGRGIVMGRSSNGKHAVMAYFIMGRSENSRNRIFVSEGGGIRTKAFDEAKCADPSLIIYSPVKVLGNQTVVTNGDQTDTVVSSLSAGSSFEEALRTREFEPDAPNFTPRISGLLDISGGEISYRLSILKSTLGNPAQCLRQFFEYQKPIAGQGHFIHTYRCDGDPIPSFEGEPVTVGIGNDAGAFANGIWKSLNNDNKVSLFVRFVDIENGENETVIINKHGSE